ncbi:Translation machinery-associated protein 46, partial [Golovinomyces cichoracearum]
MPPKKAEKQGGGKKPSAAKIVEDRTFGMKNKKGAQTQKQIAQMTQSAKAGGTPEEKKLCKYFITAVEDGKYGWFWTCPNGGDKCMYQHKLPPGFILKTKEQRAAEKALMDKSPLKTLTLEDFLESERHKHTGNLTPVTPETFQKWRAERVNKKFAEEQAHLAKEATGRALFEKGDWNVAPEESDGEDDDNNAWN